MVDLSPRFGQTFLAEGGGGAELYVNENAIIVESMGALAIIDRDLAAPPGSPTQGDTYLVDTAATGDWSGQDDNLAIWTGTRWVFILPKEGFRGRIIDEAQNVFYDGADWIFDVGLQLTSLGPLGDVGGIVYSDGTKLVLSAGPPGSNYVPYWNGSTIAWDAYTP